MKIKRLLAIFLIMLSMIMILTGCGKKKEQEPQGPTFEEQYGEYKPKMWYLEDNATGSKIYLFGSIHIGVEKMYPLPDTVLNAFNESEVLCVEHDVTKIEEDYELAMQMLEYMIYSDDTLLKDHLSEERLNELQTIGEKYDLLDVGDLPYKPIFYSEYISQMALEETEYDMMLGVDRHLLTEAKSRGMEIEDIENPIEVYQLLGGLSDKVGEYLIYDLVETFSDEDKMIEELDGMFKAWVNGRIDEFIEEMEEKYKEKFEQYKKEAEEYDNALLTVRNVTMVDKIVEYLKTGKKYFYVVGGAHYGGEDGIITLLKNKGYNVEQVIY